MEEFTMAKLDALMELCEPPDCFITSWEVGDNLAKSKGWDSLKHAEQAGAVVLRDHGDGTVSVFRPDGPGAKALKASAK